MAKKGSIVIGWCALHYFSISREKFNVKCRKARRGKQCKHFGRSIPQWNTNLKKENHRGD